MFETKFNTKHIKSKWSGTNEETNSDTYFIKSQCKITPAYRINKEEGERYPILEMKNAISLSVKKMLNDEIFDKKYIFDIDLSETSPCFGKSSFLKFALYYNILGNKSNSAQIMKKILSYFETEIENILKTYNFTWIEE